MSSSHGEELGMLEQLPALIPNLTGWGAFLSLATLMVMGFVKGWVYPASVTNMFKQAWETEQQTRRDIEDAKNSALLKQGEALLAQMTSLNQVAREAGERDKGRTES